MNIAELAIRKRVITLTLIVVVTVLGLRAYQTMGRLEDPEFTIKEATVVTHYPGASAREVEEEVTDPIETKIQEMGEVKRIYSRNKPGVSIISVEMKDRYDWDSLPQVWQKLRAKVGDVQRRLPPGALPSLVNDDFGDVYGVLYALTGDGYSDAELRDFAKFLRRELLLVDGVAKIVLQGVQPEVIYVDIDRARLARLGIGLDEVFTMLAEKNTLREAGKVQVGRDFLRIEPSGAVNAVDDIRKLVIRGQENDGRARLITLGDIATVRRSYEEPFRERMRYDGQPAIALAISTEQGGNVVAMGRALERRLEELKPRIPVGLEIHPVSLQYVSVTTAIDAFIVNLGEAVLIVFVVLMIFMGLRSGLIIGAALVLTVLATFVLMKMQGIMLERISLGALVIALGMLVDNAIVVIDGMLVRIAQGRDRIAAAVEVVRQNQWPLLGATVIAVLAFGAIGLSQDSTGEYTRSLFYVILYSLLLSWIIAITVVPLLGVLFLKAPAEGTTTEAAEPGGLYQHLRSGLEICLRHRYATLGILVGLLLGAMVLFGLLKQSFFPNSTRDQFMIDFYLPKGTDIRVVEREANRLQQKLREDERIRDVTLFVGSTAPRFILTYTPEKDPSAYAFFLVGVHDYHDIDGLIADYYRKIPEWFPDANPRIHKFRLGPGKPPVEAAFYGPDPKVLRRLGAEAERILLKAGAVAVRSEWGNRVLTVEPRFDEDRASKVGVSREDLADSLQMNFLGLDVGVYRERDELLPIKVRAGEANRRSSEIMNSQVWSSGLRTFVPIGQVASDYDLIWEDVSSNRKNRKRWFKVVADPAPGMLNSEIFRRVKAPIEAIPRPPGYDFEWEGEYLSQQEARAGLMASLPLFFGMMVLVVVLLFDSLRKTLVIWLTVPLALIGVAVGLFLFDQPFDFMATLGFMSLSGMLIKNSIVLLDEIDLEIGEGRPPYAAILHAVQSRARPVVMAALTTVLGMIPLLTDPFYVAMAVTIMAGLTFATVLSLVVVPVLYALFFRVPAPAD